MQKQGNAEWWLQGNSSEGQATHHLNAKPVLWISLTSEGKKKPKGGFLNPIC